MEKYGFVYIWFDRKHKRYYIGAHWGTEDDGYICSSPWMIKAYKNRPQDFKRRILSRIYTTKRNTFIEEQRWLDMIDINDLKPYAKKPRYYNLRVKNGKYWHLTEEASKTVREKISISVKQSLLNPVTQERKKIAYQTRDTKSSDPDVRKKRRQTMINNGKNKGKITATDSTGEIFHITKDDPRWISGEAWSIAKGKKRQPISESHKQQIKSLGNFRKLNSTKVTCIHCGAIGNVGNIARYHNDRCKNKQLLAS